MASNISVQKTQAEAKYAACKDQKKAFEVTTVWNLDMYYTRQIRPET